MALQDPSQDHAKARAVQTLCAGGNAHSPSDCFGWSACLLCPLRGKKKLGRHIPYIHQVARLVARIASA